jgi:hypothetical protein
MQVLFNCIVLDIDGVLNNYSSRKHKEVCDFHSKIFKDEEFVKDDFNFDQKCIDALNHLISSLSNPKIVISSNWRYNAHPDNFHSMFNVVGVKYTPIELIEGVELDHVPEYKRSSLILEYFNTHKDTKSWCTIDDRKDLFVEGFQNVVFTDPHKGLTEADVKEFLKKVSHEAPPTSPESI